MAYNRRTLPSHNKGKKLGKKTAQDHKNTRREVHQIKDEIRNFAKTEWGQRWVDAILNIGRPFRMQRGIRYAQENRIDNLNITPGQIFATVQGTAPTPYRVKIQFEIIPEEGWFKLLEFIGSKAKYIINLLENRMPHDIIEVFDNIGFPLYPNPSRIQSSCSCPDQEIPCKHIAATILYIALVIDFNPFLLFKLRGKEKEEILAYLKHHRSCSNEPITKTYKTLRTQFDFSQESFEVPIITAEDLSSKHFDKSDDINLSFRFSKPTGVIETLDSIGTAPNLAEPENFDFVMRDLYLTVMKKAYKIKKKSESKAK